MALKKSVGMQKLKNLGRPTTMQIIVMGLAVVLAIVLVIFLRGFVACWSLTALPGIQPPSCPTAGDPVTNPEGTPMDVTATPPLSIPLAELPPPWDGASRVTVLLIGLDYRDWEAGLGAPRSDTMMLLTLDPQTMTAGMLSIPRDMWVNIPGYGYSKINNAYAFGEGDQLPGGGAGLAMKTVESFLGIPIQYYARVDFSTFEKMVDIIGGICIDVPYTIIIDPLGPHNTATLEPGYECINGSEALAYARARDVEQGVLGGDVERGQHQQQVVLAIRDKVLANLAALITQAPALYNELSAGVDTNLTLDDIMRLAMLAKDIKTEDITTGGINYTMMEDAKYDLNGQELAVLRPYPDAIRDLVDSIFGGGAMLPAAQGDITQNMQAEAARVAIVNGSGVEGLASQTTDYLKGQGMNVVGFGNTGDYPAAYAYPFPDRTVVIIHGESLYAMQYLQTLMGFDTSSQVIFDYNPDASADIIVALGYDWGNDHPMP
jgi:LCP family protein required for cell wall assembly